MKKRPFLILFILLIASNMQSQSSNVRDASTSPDPKIVTIVNELDPGFSFNFRVTDPALEFDCIDKKRTLSTDFKFIELKQSYQLSASVYWCRPDIQYTIKRAEKDTRFVFMNSRDQAANNEINFFQLMNDSLFKDRDDLEVLARTIFWPLKTAPKINSKMDYGKKMKFLEDYQKIHPLSSSFSDLCRKMFFVEYIGGLIYEFTYEPSNAESLKKEILNAKPIIQNDELLFCGYYKVFISKYNYFLTLNKYGKENSSPNVEYATAKENFTNKSLNFLLFNIIDSYLNTTKFDIQPLLTTFFNDCTDEVYIKAIREKMEAKKVIATLSNDQMLTMGLKKISLQQIIAENKGKLIYMDFWASWCAPCREMMKESRLIHEKYKDKVVFIYISKDTDLISWKKASVEEGLNETNSFCISGDADFIKFHKIKSIPRYVLFDKTGKILTDDAPRPNTRELADLLSKN